MIYRCCDHLRLSKTTLNGIVYLEVIDRDLNEIDPLRQKTLLVHCLKPVAGLSGGNVLVLGGERVQNIEVEWAAPASPLPAKLLEPGESDVKNIVSGLTDGASTLVVRTSVAGDFSSYTLKLATSALDSTPPADFDPQLVALDFSFKVECPSDFDCRQDAACPPAGRAAPEIDYLAKDYASFRRLLLARMAHVVPQWQQSSAADYGIAVAELLAYAGDQLSYWQDAIGTEAYIGTARKRISLRRHALLVDYPMHDGRNARAWLHLNVKPAACQLDLLHTRFLTRCPGYATGIEDGSAALAQAMESAPVVFEPLIDPRYAATGYTQTLHSVHNRMPFYTWNDDRCCLTKGATRATLGDQYPDLRPGDVLLLEEILGPYTGIAGDADPSHRHAVRLTSVATTNDLSNGHPITEIEWAAEDALPFSLCISGKADAAHGGKSLSDISVARGNIVLVDHGQTVEGEDLGQMPQPAMYLAQGNVSPCNPPSPVPVAPRFRPRLARSPLTQAVGQFQTIGNDHGTLLAEDLSSAPAAKIFEDDMAGILPQVALSGDKDGNSRPWYAERTLLTLTPTDTNFVVEIDDDGAAQLRFGDDEHGMRPTPPTAFTAAYRIGNGTAGNVGAEAICHIVCKAADFANVAAVRNPMPARGGIDPESADSVRRNAPEAFRTQERAVTTDDYAEIAGRDPRVQRAAATLRWTGSWHTVFVTVDPLADADRGKLKNELVPFMDRFRMTGHDLEFDTPRYVSLEIELCVCVDGGHLRSDVKQRLLQIFSNRVLPDGQRGLFHPDNFSFGQPVYLSPIYAAAHKVPGVASVRVTAFQRQGIDDQTYLAAGVLPIGRLEIARLDNDPNFPEHGVLRLDLKGGK